ncbi:MAG: hypothetical protein RQ741_04730 [Wenzhouxiangellaceae bacterium]|nr:hypothetical protein [Wenzhouxiangellaceae bacterium]
MKRVFLMIAAALVLSACSLPQKQQDQRRTETLDRFEAVLRWNEFDAVTDFMHPDWLEENPVTQLDVDRLHQFRVTQYTLRQVVAEEDGSGIDRLVQLRMYHIHSARERVIEYLEAWRWDEERERWMLHSGLPDVTQRR